MQAPFSPHRQVSRLVFEAGVTRVAANGQSLSTVRQEGYRAFMGIGDAMPGGAVAALALVGF